MSSSENETPETSDQSPDTSANQTSHYIDFLDEWAKWVEDNERGTLEVQYNKDEDVYSVERDEREAVVYTSDIDEEFYGEAQALFVESEIGEPPTNLDLSQTLKFSGNELVLSRISLSERNSKTLLIVEAATPISHLAPANFDLAVKEVSTIARDLRKHLSGVLKTS